MDDDPGEKDKKQMGIQLKAILETVIYSKPIFHRRP